MNAKVYRLNNRDLELEFLEYDSTPGTHTSLRLPISKVDAKKLAQHIEELTRC